MYKDIKKDIHKIYKLYDNYIITSIVSSVYLHSV